jgi:hypothetical protein
VLVNQEIQKFKSWEDHQLGSHVVAKFEAAKLGSVLFDVEGFGVIGVEFENEGTLNYEVEISESFRELLDNGDVNASGLLGDFDGIAGDSDVQSSISKFAVTLPNSLFSQYPSPKPIHRQKVGRSLIVAKKVCSQRGLKGQLLKDCEKDVEMTGDARWAKIESDSKNLDKEVEDEDENVDTEIEIDSFWSEEPSTMRHALFDDVDQALQELSW